MIITLGTDPPLFSQHTIGTYEKTEKSGLEIFDEGENIPGASPPPEKIFRDLRPHWQNIPGASRPPEKYPGCFASTGKIFRGGGEAGLHAIRKIFGALRAGKFLLNLAPEERRGPL